MHAHKEAWAVVTVDICKYYEVVKCMLSLQTDFLFQILLELNMGL